MGTPFFKIETVQRRYGVQVFSSNHALYADMSGRVMATLETMAPALEIYSIGEAFMHIGGIVRQRLGLFNNVGEDLTDRLCQRHIPPD